MTNIQQYSDKIVVWIIQVFPFTKINRTVHVSCMYFTLCKLHFDKRKTYI